MLPTGNYYEALRDAKLAIQLQPSYLKAIIRGRVFLILFDNLLTVSRILHDFHRSRDRFLSRNLCFSLSSIEKPVGDVT